MNARNWDICSKKGFKGNLLEEITRVITLKRYVWLDTMMKEELGLIVDEVYNPIAKAITTFIAFYIVGLILLIPFFLYFFKSYFFSSVFYCLN